MDPELIKKKLPKWLGKIIEVFIDKDAYCRPGYRELELWVSQRGHESFLAIANQYTGHLIELNEHRGLLIINPVTHEDECDNALQICIPLEWIRRIDVFYKPADSLAV
jgi:hypothetical protein